MERGGTRLRAGPAAPPLPLPLPLLDDQHDEAAAALADARRRLEELLLQMAVPANTSDDGAAGALQGLPAWPDVVAFDDDGDGDGGDGTIDLDRLLSSHCGGAATSDDDDDDEARSGKNDGGDGYFGGARRRRLEEAIESLWRGACGGKRSGGGGNDGAPAITAAAAAAALAQLASPRAHAEDLLECAGWPRLAEALPHFLAARTADGGGGCRQGESEEASAADGAAACVLRRLAPAVLDGAPAAAAQLLRPLLERLLLHGVCRGAVDAAAAAAAVSQPAEAAAREQSEAAATTADTAGGGKPAPTYETAEREALCFALRALHSLGRSWHFVPAALARPLAAAISRAALQGAAAAAIDGSACGGAGRATVLEALLRLDARMLWWRRLFAVAAFKRSLLDNNAAANALLADTLPPLWLNAVPLPLAADWRRRGAAAATRAVLQGSERTAGALLRVDGPELEGLLAAARAWLLKARED